MKLGDIYTDGEFRAHLTKLLNGNSHYVDDLIQDCMVIAVRKGYDLDEAAEKDKLRYLLWAIAKNKVYEKRSTFKRRHYSQRLINYCEPVRSPLMEDLDEFEVCGDLCDFELLLFEALSRENMTDISKNSHVDYTQLRKHTKKLKEKFIAWKKSREE